jgi:hypothetical protein
MMNRRMPPETGASLFLRRAMPFAIKTLGGPAPGVRITDNLDDYGLSWPLPDYLPGTEDMGGRYKKVSESKLSAESANHPNVGVGAVYEWEKN